MQERNCLVCVMLVIAMELISSMFSARVASMEPHDVPVQQECQNDILQSSLKADVIVFNGLFFSYVAVFKHFISVEIRSFIFFEFLFF